MYVYLAVYIYVYHFSFPIKRFFHLFKYKKGPLPPLSLSYIVVFYGSVQMINIG